MASCGLNTTCKNGRVCSKHFTSSDYIKTLRHILMNEPAKFKLKPDAIPTLEIDSEVKKFKFGHTKCTSESDTTPANNDDGSLNVHEESDKKITISQAVYNLLIKKVDEYEVLKSNLKKIYTSEQIRCLGKPDQSSEDITAALSLRSVSPKPIKTEMIIKQEVDVEYEYDPIMTSENTIKKEHNHDKCEKSMKIKRPKKFICKICGATCLSSAVLKHHRRKHTGEKPYTCDICNKRFSMPFNLRIHIRIHTGEKPFKCVYCDKAFRHSGYLWRHKQVNHIHTGTKRYECNLCKKRFSQSSGLKLHIRTVHMKLPAPYQRRRMKQAAKSTEKVDSVMRGPNKVVDINRGDTSQAAAQIMVPCEWGPETCDASFEHNEDNSGGGPSVAAFCVPILDPDPDLKNHEEEND